VLRTPLIAIAPARSERVGQGLSRSLEPALLALQAVENLSLPALLDSLEPHRRDVDRHPVLEAGAEESMHVRVCRPVLATVLMDREDALNSAGGTTESPLHSITHDALREAAVEALEPFRRRVVHGHDEAEVGWVPQPAAVIAEGLSDGSLVTSKGTVSLANPVELPPLAMR
jgi:hypothetical protein